MKIVVVTNIPAPYRTPVYNMVASELGADFHVVFCAHNEPNRKWEFNDLGFNHTFLRENYHLSGGAAVHRNLDVIGVLRRHQPQVIITTGFSPTYLYAWAYALASNAGHIPMTDGWLDSESKLSIAHRAIRRIVYRTSAAFLGASLKSLRLYESYGVDHRHLFQSCLCIDNDRFISSACNTERPYDLMYAGQIIEAKNPDLFIDVVRHVKLKRGAVRVLVIGDGAMRQTFLDALKDVGAEVEYGGFASQRDLPRYYSSAKLMLFTTNKDAWGIVANEALASGTPVITTPYAGVADEIVINGSNGFVLEPDYQLWGEKVTAILENPEMMAEMRVNAAKSVGEYTFENAARGILSAANWACNRRRGAYRKLGK